MKEILSERAKEVFGSGCEVVSVERLLGGAQKHVWLAVCADGFKFAAYQWDSSKTYFGEDFSGPFCSSSAELFELNNRQMTESGVLTPKLYNMDRSRTLGDYELALVEYIDGADMDHIMEKEPERLDRALGSLRESIERLHSMKSPRMGQLGRLMGPEADPVELERLALLAACQPQNQRSAEMCGAARQEKKLSRKQSPAQTHPGAQKEKKAPCQDLDSN